MSGFIEYTRSRTIFIPRKKDQKPNIFLRILGLFGMHLKRERYIALHIKEVGREGF